MVRVMIPSWWGDVDFTFTPTWLSVIYAKARQQNGRRGQGQSTGVYCEMEVVGEEMPIDSRNPFENGPGNQRHLNSNPSLP